MPIITIGMVVVAAWAAWVGGVPKSRSGRPDGRSVSAYRRPAVGRALVLDDADTRDFRPLLGACADRPCNCTAAEQRDELTAPHSRTSLARATNTSDKETPSDAAVFRLTAM